MGQWGLSTQIVHEGKPALRRFAECAERGEPFDVAVIGAQLTDIAIGDVVRGLRTLPGGATLPLIVLTQLGTGATLSEVEGEIAAQVAKPLRPSELYNCLLGAFGAGQAKASGHEPEVVSVQFTGLSILIVDDNHINRFVASEQVEQAGYTPVTANNGAEAVDAVKHGRFAAVLMDCQMPVMDGYTAAAEIRNWEAGGSRIPIIALTAHAMPGEREKVLTAGMDDYLSKPLRPHSLERMLKRHVQREAIPESRAEAAVPPETQGECVALSRDIPRSRKLIGLFLGQIPDQLDGLDKAMDAGDLELLAQRAHKMKGSCMALGADRMAKVAERLQHEAPNSDLAWARERVTEAHEHFAVVSGLLLGEHPSLAPPPPG
jgi:CheY-like chemotaxis protein/HPt (histidine-containing phosphotransfer) domain-containing protein